VEDLSELVSFVPDSDSLKREIDEKSERKGLFSHQAVILLLPSCG